MLMVHYLSCFVAKVATVLKFQVSQRLDLLDLKFHVCEHQPTQGLVSKSLVSIKGPKLQLLVRVSFSHSFELAILIVVLPSEQQVSRQPLLPICLKLQEIPSLLAC